MKNSTHFITIVWLITMSGCGNENAYIDAQQAILGRWEIIETTYGPITDPAEYEEYHPDSTHIVYNYEEEVFYRSKYWLNDSLLYLQHVYVDQASGDTILVSTLPYRYTFLTHDKLQLELLYPSMNPLSVYKRIE
jgi:hypothetical protein